MTRKPQTFGQRVRALRGARTQDECCRAAGITRQSTWSEIETDNANPTLSTLRKIAKGLGFTLSELFDEAES